MRERPKAISLTDAAASQVKAIMAAADKPYIGVRVGVKSGGCAGFAYTMDYAENAGPHDEVIEDKGVKVLIEPAAIMYLLGTEMDFAQDKFTSGFTFNNPNETDRCGCGESVKF